MTSPSSEDRDETDAAQRAIDAPEAEAREVRAIVAAVRSGDSDAFNALVVRYQRPLFGLVLMMVRSPEGAEEVAQDALVRAYTRLDRYDEQRPFYPWLATIAVRLAQNWLRHHARVLVREGAPLDADRDLAGAVPAIDRLITDERDRGLWASVSGLPSGERTAVALSYRQQMRVSDIAHALGVTAGTVKTLLFRARKRLRRELGDAAMDGDEST